MDVRTDSCEHHVGKQNAYTNMPSFYYEDLIFLVQQRYVCSVVHME